MSELKIIDAHHHFWDLSNGSIYYPWLQDEAPEPFFLGENDALKSDFLPPDYRRDSANHNIVQTVHVEAECSRDQQLLETEWLTSLNKTQGMPGAIVAHAWFHTPDAQSILEQQAQFPLVRGIRSKPVTRSNPNGSLPGSAGTMTDPQWLAGLQQLRRFNLSWDLRVPTWHLQEAATVLQTIPDTPVVLNHTGFPWDRSADGLEMWRAGMKDLAARDNCFCKLSCLCLPDGPWDYESNRELVLEAIDLFGVERCMFASNFPVDGLRVNMDTLWRDYKRMTEDFSITDRERLFYGSAAEFYRI
ncbi:MAG: amidohydrolase family protein [Burkholderiaceae bacterium]